MYVYICMCIYIYILYIYILYYIYMCFFMGGCSIWHMVCSLRKRDGLQGSIGALFVQLRVCARRQATANDDGGQCLDHVRHLKGGWMIFQV